MSQDEILKLEEEERELVEKLRSIRELKAQKAKEEKEKEEFLEKERLANLPLDIHIVSLRDGYVTVHARWRQDIFDIWKTTPGHIYKGYVTHSQNHLTSYKGIGINIIPIGNWREAEKRLSDLPNSSMNYEGNTFDLINYELDAPPWEIDISPNGRNFLAKLGPRTQSWTLRNISAATWDYTDNSAIIPISEGWRIPSALKDVEGVVYTDAALLLITQQIERRAKIDVIASKEDSDDPRIKKYLTHPVKNRFGITVPLHEFLEPFQRVGIEFALETNGRFILSDDTGLGKTVQSLCYAEIQRLSEKPEFITLIVCKASNIPNWKREVFRFTGIAPVVAQNGYYRDKLVGHVLQDRPNYIIISHETLGTYENPDGNDEIKVFMWANVFKILKPDLLIVDEAHQIKNPSTNRSQAVRMLYDTPHIIPATASPIKNRTSEFWPSLFLVDPILFKSHDNFISTYTLDGQRPKNMKDFQDLIRPVFLRRLKKDVLKDLPPINRIQKYAELSERGKKLVEKAEAMIYERIATYSAKGEGGDEKEMFVILEKILRLIQIAADQTTEFTAELASDTISASEDPNSKVLIFSRFKGTAYKIARLLGHEAVCTVEKSIQKKNGEPLFRSMNAVERDNLFESVRDNPKIRYIVTTTASKEGHNLEFCNWVIFNELMWTPEDHVQCEGRAFGRLANPHAIDSFYVLAETQIVQWLWELLEVKVEVIQEAVEGIESSRDISLSVMKELINKLKEAGYKRSAV